MLLPLLQPDYLSIRAMNAPEAGGVGFDGFKQGEVIEGPPGDPALFFV